MLQCDILVAGGGLAAMKSALTAAQSGLKVLWVTKTRLCGGASFYPMMDRVACLCATGDPQQDEQYLYEILDAGQGMASEKMNRIYIANIRRQVEEFPQMGVDNARQTEPRVACFAQTARPTFAWSDWKHIRKNLYSLLQGYDNLQVMEYTAVLSILKTDGAVSGAVLLQKGRRLSVACKSLILATGGMGDLYQYNLNTPDVSGDGQVLALQAGAELINVEFIQFIPGFVSPAFKTVFRETTIPYLQQLQNEKGEDLLTPYLPDAAERAECLRLRATHGPFTSRSLDRWFDIAMMESILAEKEETPGFAIRYRPEIAREPSSFVAPYYRWLKEKHGVDLSRDEIHIAPFYHAANGGIRIDERCQTRVPGLFACGEASGGIHGADRLGGHSTGGCLVFGHIAGKQAAEYAMGAVQRKPQPEAEALHRDYAGRGSLTPDQLLPEIRRLMFRTGGVIRRESALQSGMAQLEEWRAGFAPLLLLDSGQALDAVKTAHFLLLGQALLAAMAARPESRGAHYRQDAPQTDPEQCVRHVVRLEESCCRVLIEEN